MESSKLHHILPHTVTPYRWEEGVYLKSIYLMSHSTKLLFVFQRSLVTPASIGGWKFFILWKKKKNSIFIWRCMLWVESTAHQTRCPTEIIDLFFFSFTFTLFLLLLSLASNSRSNNIDYEEENFKPRDAVEPPGISATILPSQYKYS